MDESWRMRMGMDAFFPFARKSMDESCSSAAATAEADDFSDVFGGPPRSVLTRKFSGDFTTRSNTFYDKIFQPSEFGSRPLPSSNSHGRSLPAFRIPAGGEGFYGDVFGSTREFGGGGGGRRTKTRARSNSSSVMTSEDVSPLRPQNATAGGGGGDDVALYAFTSRLRPINVPGRHRTGQQPEVKQEGIPVFRQIHDPFLGHENTLENEDFYYGSSQGFFAAAAGGGGFSRRASPETISLDPNSFRSIKLSMDDLGPSSPASSPVSSVCHVTEPKEMIRGFTAAGEEAAEPEEEEDDDKEDEVMSSYVIEISSDRFDRCREVGGSESIDIDEAIAWAKERFLRPDDKEKMMETETQSREEVSGNSTLNSSSMEEEDNNLTGEKGKPDERMAMEMKDEDIRLWLIGKENNVRLLLSSLHHILWPKSGWFAVPLANLRDGLQVKKAYQKARLCLHPDKLQQRGASPSQKYVAQKIFSILQDAWAEYLAGEGFLN